MIDWGLLLGLFYEKAQSDCRLSPAHVSLYFALIHEAGHTLAIPFYLRRSALMSKAKIYSSVTMNRCLRALHEYGYIDYRPSHSPGESRVMILMLSS